MNIGISGSFTAMNYYTLYKDLAAAKHQENWLVTGHGKRRPPNALSAAPAKKPARSILKSAQTGKGY